MSAAPEPVADDPSAAKPDDGVGRRLNRLLRLAPLDLNIRHQLLWLFGLLLVTGATVLVLDEINQRETVATLTRLRDNSLSGLRYVKAISDSYGIDIVDSTFRVRNKLMGWDQGVEVLDRATARIQQEWEKLLTTEMTPEQRSLVDEIARHRQTADRAAAKLRAILKTKDPSAIATFADTELYPAIDPVTTRLQFLSDLQMIAAEQRLSEDARRAQNISRWRVGLSLFTFFVVIVVGRQILRHIYRGVEKLVHLANATRRGDYAEPAGRIPRGELGEVTRAFLEMRESLERNEIDLRESEAHAQDANRAKSSFLAAMSHEIRTPMIGVTGMLELLSHTELDAEQRRCVDVIENSAQALLQIIGDILDFSKIEAGKLELQPEAVDLRRLVEGTVNNYLGVASAKGITLDLHIDERVCVAHLADPLRLRQIVANFVSNALKFTHKGSVTIDVDLVLEDETTQTIALRVHDTGIGISQEAQERLFAPFAQGDHDATRNYGGTGLGLAICRRLAQLMGGELGLRSQLGEGTTVSLVVRLPISSSDAVAAIGALAPPALAQRPVPSIAEAERERSLVLLVDDHPTNREVVTRQLARAGFACESASDGEEALEKWKLGRHALLLADIHMPRMDGYALVAAIRAIEKREQRARTPVIALTANVTKGEAERCLAAGMDDFLGKPVSIAQLAKKLHQWLPHVVFPVDERPPPRAGGGAIGRTPTTITGAPAIDQTPLLEIAGGDERLAANLLHDFIDSARRDVAALHDALSRDDVDGAARELHRIKGACRLVGAIDLAAAALDLENRLRSVDAAERARLAARVVAALDTLVRWHTAAA